ncbi:hypothetical protein PVAG01_02152 [Phlyctema vagabunda]|uniref:Uncharacterized protein n=1 Tax=Phlyctema vagabunda TaxID=108571 RepID=A0ABR4PR32_9HELO
MVQRSQATTAWLAASVAALFIALVSSQNAGTQCYVLDGTARRGFYRCNNETAGHTTCCDLGDTCYSNGVCAGPNNGIMDYQRKGCTDPTWQDPACLNQCQPYANFSTAGIRWCGSSIESTTDYCCDPGGSGIGSFACCRNQSLLFELSPVASSIATIESTAVVSYPPASSTSGASTSSSSSTGTAAATTTSASSTPTNTASGGGESSTNGAAIGAGVGVPVAVILAAAIGFFFWRRKKAAKTSQPYELQNGEQGGYTQAPYADANSPQGAHAPYDAEAQPKGYFAGRQYDPPQELPTQDVVHEMGTDTAMKR